MMNQSVKKALPLFLPPITFALPPQNGHRFGSLVSGDESGFGLEGDSASHAFAATIVVSTIGPRQPQTVHSACTRWRELDLLQTYLALLPHVGQGFRGSLIPSPPLSSSRLTARRCMFDSSRRVFPGTHSECLASLHSGKGTRYSICASTVHSPC